jgi:hypothetical protein
LACPRPTYPEKWIFESKFRNLSQSLEFLVKYLEILVKISDFESKNGILTQKSESLVKRPEV